MQLQQLRSLSSILSSLLMACRPKHIHSYTVKFKILVVDLLRKNDRNVSKTAGEFEMTGKEFKNGTRTMTN